MPHATGVRPTKTLRESALPRSSAQREIWRKCGQIPGRFISPGTTLTGATSTIAYRDFLDKRPSATDNSAKYPLSSGGKTIAQKQRLSYASSIDPGAFVPGVERSDHATFPALAARTGLAVASCSCPADTVHTRLFRRYLAVAIQR